MKKVLIVLITVLGFASCSSDDDNPENVYVLELSPPNWIIDTWLEYGSNNVGFRFEQNDIYVLNGTNNEISFLTTGGEVLSEGHGYILREELKTSSEYWVYTESIDENTGQTLTGTYPKTWKWEASCGNAINSNSCGCKLRNEIPLSPPLVDFNINLNLPEYEALNYPGNSVTIANQGIKGIVVYSINDAIYSAYELSDPNHSPNNCSEMSIDGVIATCQCSDGNIYNIITGEHQSQDVCILPMLRYSAIRTGDNIIVTNN